MPAGTIANYYHTDSVGWIQLEAGPAGITRIAYVAQPGPEPETGTNSHIDRLKEQLDAYFSGVPVEFDVPLDMNGTTAFQRSVWNALREIPYGETRSYRDIAAAVGNPKASRAVGTANKSNRIPIVIPCHRVVRSDGGLGGYDSGTDIKRVLLDLERAGNRQSAPTE